VFSASPARCNGIRLICTRDGALGQCADVCQHGQSSRVRPASDSAQAPTPPFVTAPTTVDEVIDRMRAIDATLPETDGVAWFNRLYLEVTVAVRQAVEAGRFQHSSFLERLDVVFAAIYLDAYDAGQHEPESVARAWAPLFAERGRRDIAPIQFALAGMNAHINHDLGIALVETVSQLGIELRRGTPEHDDYHTVNRLLVETEERVKHWFATGFLAVIDRTFGRLDDVLAMWNVERARDAAWTTGETLEVLAKVPVVRTHYLDALARTVGFAGRGLLIPTLTEQRSTDTTS
jgi:hypothetical protein